MILIREKFEAAGLQVLDISLGKVRIRYREDQVTKEQIKQLLKENGFDLLVDKEDKIVTLVKVAVVELVHHLNNVNSIVRKSDYLVEKLGLSYQYLSKIFSEHENITLEKYIILQKIERIKHLLDEDEYSLSEIAYMMDYSSVQYLSNQFKKYTGITVSQYKAGSEVTIRPIDEL